MTWTSSLPATVAVALSLTLVAGCSGAGNKSDRASAGASASASTHAGKGALLPGETTATMSASAAAKVTNQVRQLPGVSNVLYDANTHTLHVYFKPGVTPAEKQHASAAIGAKGA